MLSPTNQKTLDAYYEHTNTGDFAGALRFFADDAVYYLPAASPAVPYAGAWKGKEGVGGVYAAFGDAFALVDMTELATVSTEDELASINDEVFVAKAGQPWRVGVAHQFKFRDGLITRLDVHLDLGAAHEALSGRSALPSALLPVSTVPGNKTVDASTTGKVVASFMAAGAKGVEAFDRDAAVFIPGDPRRLRFAGSWTGHEEIAQAQTHWSNSYQGEFTVERTIVEGGNAFVMAHLKGTFTPTRVAIDQPVCLFFQLGGAGRIARVYWYLNTYPFVALAQ